MPPISSKTFISRLKKLFKGCTIELVYIYDDKETLLVNGEVIDLLWMPHIKTIADSEVVNILYSDCKKSIRKLIKKQNREKTNEQY
tara:strand:+ start:758 stop:1015 length:258 start_codon:yes stop_codon:yes gene_type:complete